MCLKVYVCVCMSDVRVCVSDVRVCVSDVRVCVSDIRVCVPVRFVYMPGVNNSNAMRFFPPIRDLISQTTFFLYASALNARTHK